MLSKLFSYFCTLILVTIIIILSPLILLTTLPLFLFRYIVSKVAKCIRPDLANILTARGTFCATDDLYNKPKWNVIVPIVFEGNVDIFLVRETFKKSIIEAQYSTGKLKYPELRQYLTTWAGYFFWKDVTNFDLNQHIKIYSDYKPNSELTEIYKTLILKKWSENIPLWEILLIPCEKTGLTTTMIVRFHHSLGDGIAWQLILNNELFKHNGSKVVQVMPTFIKRSLCAKILFTLTFPFRSIYSAIELAKNCYPKLPFALPPTRGELVLGNSYAIDLKKFKEIKKYYKVSLCSVVYSVIAGAIRETLIKKGEKLPVIFPVQIPLPLPGHSVKFRNYVTVGVVNLPTGEADPVQRLKYSNGDYIRLKNSAIPLIVNHGMKSIGSSCSWIVRKFKKSAQKSGLAVAISNFPAGLDYLSLNEHKIEQVSLYGGLTDQGLSISICVLSYVEHFRFSVSADSAVLSETDVKDIPKLIESQIDILYRNAVNDV